MDPAVPRNNCSVQKQKLPPSACGVRNYLTIASQSQFLRRLCITNMGIHSIPPVFTVGRVTSLTHLSIFQTPMHMKNGVNMPDILILLPLQYLPSRSMHSTDCHLWNLLMYILFTSQIIMPTDFSFLSIGQSLNN